jgi:amidohydrolase
LDIESLLAAAHDLAPRIVEWRRTLHRWPELAFAEQRTAALVAARLHEWGIPHETEVAQTGVVGRVGAATGPTIALRADMDALPIHEENDVPYRSERPGLMHACGHDAHTAMLLAAARLLKEHEAKLPGRVKFIFQPAEEVIPDEGGSGAWRMIAEGVLDDVDAIVGLHVDPTLPTGQIGIRPGPLMAAADRFELTILGKAAHGAHPYQGVDAIVLAAQVVTAAQTLVSRRIPASKEAVVTFGTIQGGSKENILCDRVVLTGTVRSFEPAVRDQLEAELAQVASLVRALGGDYRLRYLRGSPPVNNDGLLTGFVSRVARHVVGADQVVDIPKSTGGEDFAWYQEKTRGTFVRLGCHHPADVPRALHTPTFDLDEAALPLGAALLAAVAVRWLEEYGHKQSRS